MIENFRIKDKNGEEIIITPQTKLYDTVNKFEFTANYTEALCPDKAWKLIIDNILTGRIIKHHGKRTK